MGIESGVYGFARRPYHGAIRFGCLDVIKGPLQGFYRVSKRVHMYNNK